MTKRKKAFVPEWKQLTWIRHPANYGDVRITVYKDHQITITNWFATGRVTYECVPTERITGEAYNINYAMAEAVGQVDSLNEKRN